MTTSAVVHLRGSSGPLRAAVRWPSARAPGLLVRFHLGSPGRDTARPDAVVLDVHLDPPHEAALRDATAVLGWAADHAPELGADPGHLLVAGTGAGAAIAAAVAVLARDEGWPRIGEQILDHPDLPEPPGAPHTGLAPATITSTPGGDGHRYAALLTDAGVDVTLHLEEGTPT